MLKYILKKKLNKENMIRIKSSKHLQAHEVLHGNQSYRIIIKSIHICNGNNSSKNKNSTSK